MAVDYVGHFRREVAAFEAAGRVAAGCEAAPAVPSCPGWVVTDLVLHLGVVHRYVARVIGERRFLFQRTDGPGTWVVHFDGEAVMLGAPDGHDDIQISGTASDLAFSFGSVP